MAKEMMRMTITPKVLAFVLAEPDPYGSLCSGGMLHTQAPALYCTLFCISLAACIMFIAMSVKYRIVDPVAHAFAACSPCRYARGKHICNCIWQVIRYVQPRAGLGAAARWKAGMLSRASALFARRGADLQSYIYATSALADGPFRSRAQVPAPQLSFPMAQHLALCQTKHLQLSRAVIPQHGLMSRCYTEQYPINGGGLVRKESPPKGHADSLKNM